MFYVVSSPTPWRPFDQGKGEKKIFVFLAEPLIDCASVEPTCAGRIGSVFTEGVRLFKEGGIGKSIADDPDCCILAADPNSV